MASKYRLNRYNWLGQKLLSQHKFDNILRLRQCLELSAEKQDASGAEANTRQQVSEYMIYLSSLALMQTNSSQLDEVIYSIQQLNFENNNQYFLLLCQCLLYLGNHDSVVALCERVIAKEVNNSSTATDDSSSTQDTKYEGLAADDYSPLVDSEFKKLFQRVDANHLVAEPRLWFILGLCLEYQNRAKDALVAYKVSSNLALGAAQDESSATQDHSSRHHHHHHHHHHHRHSSSSRAVNTASLNNFHECHLKYAQLCVRLRGDYKRAAQVLSRALARFPQNYTLNPLLSLISCSGLNSNMNHFNRALDMLQMLENYSTTNRNPSASYNNLALRCQQRQQSIDSPETIITTTMTGESNDYESKFKLHYLLIKVHLQINSLAQDSSSWPNAFAIRAQPSTNSSYQLDKDKKLDQMIELMRNSDVSSWQSSSLWNNLAVCCLLRGKTIASLTCLLKAQQLDLLDWRISYNLALVSLQVGQMSRALCSLLAAKQLYESDQKRRPKDTKNCGSSLPKLITSLVAICFDRLNQVDEARRLHIEATRSQSVDPFGKPLGTPIVCIINYLIYLHRSSTVAEQDSQTIKLKLHLLDLVEQLWLQRNQNDGQFNVFLLDIANKIGQKLNSSNAIESGKARKTYAWTKVDDGEKVIQNDDDCDKIENV